MKTLSNILKTNYGDFMDGNQLPSFTEGTVIVAIMNKGYSITCPPQTYHNITCPMCGSPNGYKVRDPDGFWWACRRRECIRKNGRMPEHIPQETKIVDLMQHMGVTKRLLNASFDDWKHSEELKAELIKYSHKPEEPYTFTGENGIGKSYSAVAIMREYYLKHKKAPIFYNVSILCHDWISQMPSIAKLIYKLTNAPLLILDDLGTRTPTDAFYDFLYLVINSRYSDMKGTVITTNLSINELSEKFGNAIVSRLLNGEMVDMEGKRLEKTRILVVQEKTSMLQCLLASTIWSALW